MAIRTHLTKQEEGIVEKGVQIRTTDPASPIVDQLWLDKTSNALKYFDGSMIVTIGGSGGGGGGSSNLSTEWGELLQALSDQEVLAYNRQPDPLSLIDTFNSQLGTLTNLQIQASTLTWQGNALTGTYVRDREVTTFIDKVTGVVVASIQAFAPKPVAITPSSSDTSPTITFFGNLTQYFPLNKPVMIFVNKISDGVRIHKHLLYNKKIALLNVTAVNYDNVNDVTTITLNNPNALDVSMGLPVTQYGLYLRVAPYDIQIEARGSLLGAYDNCNLKTAYCEGSLRLYGEQMQQIAGISGIAGLNSIWGYEVGFSPSKQYGVLKVGEIVNISGSEYTRYHWWWTANGGATWTKFSKTYDSAIHSAPDVYEDTGYFNIRNGVFVADNGRVITAYTGANWLIMLFDYAYLTEPTPTLNNFYIWNHSAANGRSGSIEGTKDNLSAFVVRANDIHASTGDQRQNFLYFTWTGSAPTFNWSYSLGNSDYIYNNSLFLYRNSSNNHVIFFSVTQFGSYNGYFYYFNADVTGNTLLNVNGGAAFTESPILTQIETQYYGLMLLQPVNANNFYIAYFNKSNPSVANLNNTGLGLLAGIYEQFINYGGNNSGNYGNPIYGVVEQTKRYLIDPTNEKRVIIPLFLIDGVYNKIWLCEIADFTNLQYPSVYNTSDNDFGYLGDTTATTQLAQVFQWSGSQSLKSVLLKLVKANTGYNWDRGDNYLSVEIQEVTGGATGMPNGNVIATSSLVLDASLIDENVSNNWVPFHFQSGVPLVNGNYYAIVLKQTYPAGTNIYNTTNTNFLIQWRSSSSNPYANGGARQFNGSTWFNFKNSASQDFCFICSPNFIVASDLDFGRESGKNGANNDFDGHCLICPTSNYEGDMVYRLLNRPNHIAFTLGANVWKRKITMKPSSEDCFVLSDRKPFGYRNADDDYDANLCFAFSPSDSKSLDKRRDGTNNGRYVNTGSQMGNAFDTYFGADPAGLRIADADFEGGYCFNCGNGQNALRFYGDGNEQLDSYSFNKKGHYFAIEAEIKPSAPLASSQQVIISSANNAGNGWWFGLLNGYLGVRQSGTGDVTIVNDIIEPTTYHKVRLVKNYVTGKWHIFRALTPPYDTWVEASSYSVQVANVALTSNGYLGYGCTTDGTQFFYGRLGYVKIMHGGKTSYLQPNAQGFYEPFAYKGYKPQYPINRMRFLYADNFGRSKWFALRYPYRKTNNEYAPELIEVIDANSSIVDSYDQVLVYEKNVLTAQGQDMGLKITMNRGSTLNKNQLRGIAFEFNGS